ncbi:hypothetical protein ACFLQL_00675 [Verrucomicrobiota bacterium]
MKINISMYGDEKQQIADQEVFRAKDFAIQSITIWMRWCGIDKVELTRVRGGISSLSELKWAGHDDTTMPSIAKQFRSYALFYIIKNLMDHFGIHIVEITLEKEELDEQRKYWQYIKDGKNETKMPASKTSETNGKQSTT